MPSITIPRDSSSSTQNSDILPSTSLHFESEDDSNSQSFNDKINFDPATFENYGFVATSDLELVNSADFEDKCSDHEFKFEESNLNFELEPFILPHDEDTTFTDELSRLALPTKKLSPLREN